jgi:hypothetical protein
MRPQFGIAFYRSIPLYQESAFVLGQGWHTTLLYRRIPYKRVALLKLSFGVLRLRHR